MANKPEIVNLCDIINHARVLLDDLSGAPLTVPATNLELITQEAEDIDDSELLWSDDDLTLYANDAVKEIALRTRCLTDKSSTLAADGLATSFTVVAADDDPVVTLDNRIIAVKRVTFSGKRLYRHYVRRLDEQDDDWYDLTGDVKYYVVDEFGGNELRMVPKTETDGTLQIEVIRLPIKYMENLSDKPETPRQYNMDLLNWIAHLAYLKNDADTYDTNQSAQHEAIFARRFGPRPTWKQGQIEYLQESGTPRGRGIFF